MPRRGGVKGEMVGLDLHRKLKKKDMDAFCTETTKKAETVGSTKEGNPFA